MAYPICSSSHTRKSSTASDSWIRRTTAGIVPYESGDLNNPHSALGTATWAFSQAYISSIYTNNINGSPLYEAITLSLVSGAKFSIKYKAYKIFGKFIYIDMDATATENITGATMGSSYAIAKVANGTTTNKIWNATSSAGFAYHNGSTLPYGLKVWVNTGGEIRVNVNSTAINKDSVIKFKIMYPTA
jgi:hypothetical protein